MEEMKFVENSKVNNEVVKIVETLKEEIISNFHPKSVILSGSFGKGEATVIENDGYLQFLSDCEVIIIPNKYIFNRDKIKQFHESFFERTGLKVSMGEVMLSVYLLFPFLNRKLKPTIQNYDLKYGSKVIYGKDYLKRIPNFKFDDIPLWEGIRLLFNRMAEALEHFSFKNPSEEMVYWTNKIVLACQDALLISAKKYHYSYKERNVTFQEIFPRHFEALGEQIPNFLPLTVKATEYKLKLNKTYTKNVVEFWFEVAEVTDKVFRYIIEKDRGITFDSYVEFQEKYLKHLYLRKKYYSGLLPNPIYQNLRSGTKMWVFSHKTPTIKLIQRIMVPWAHIVYSMISVLYFGLSKRSGVDKISLQRVMEILSWFKELKDPKYNFSEYEYVKEQVLDWWRCIC